MRRRTITLPANGWEPRSYQIPAWNAMLSPDTHTSVLAWHRRAGKDDIALHGLAVRALQRTANYMYCLPQYNQARKAIWEAINPHTGKIRWKEAFPDEIIKHVDNQTMKLELVNGSTIQMVGSDHPDNLVGTPPLGIVFSEAALSNPTAYALLRPILVENSGWSWHISSVRGRNHFHDLYQLAKEDPTGFASHLSAHDTEVFTPHQLATERQYYQKMWGRTMGTSLFEQEYLGDWDAAVVGAVFGEEIRAMEQDGRVTPLTYDPRFPVDTSWDIGIGDPTVILFWQTVGNLELLIDWYSSTDTGLPHYAKVLKEKGYYYGKHYVPHDGAHREWGSGLGRAKMAQNLGLKFTPTPNLPKATSISLGSAFLERTVINAGSIQPEDMFEDCYHVLNAFKNYRFKYDRERRVMSKTPIHDWTSHIADAMMVRAAHARVGQIAFSPNSPEEAVGNFNSMRLRDIMNSKRPSNRGAWG